MDNTGKYLYLPNDENFPDVFLPKATYGRAKLELIVEEARNKAEDSGYSPIDELLEMDEFVPLKGTMVDVSKDRPAVLYTSDLDELEVFDLSDMLGWENGDGGPMRCVDDVSDIDTHGLLIDLDDLQYVAANTMCWKGVYRVNIVYDEETGGVDILYPGDYATRVDEDSPYICLSVGITSTAQEIMDAIYEALQEEERDKAF